MAREERTGLVTGAKELPSIKDLEGSTTRTQRVFSARQWGSSWFVVDQGRDYGAAGGRATSTVGGEPPARLSRQQRRARASVAATVAVSALMVASMVKKKASAADGELGPFTKAGFAPLDTPHFKPPEKLWGEVGGAPYRTGAWWLNWVIDDGEAPAPATPYQIGCDKVGASVSYSARRREADFSAQIDAYGVDFLAIPVAASAWLDADDLESRVNSFQKEYADGQFVDAADALRAVMKKKAITGAESRSLSEHSHLGAHMRYATAEGPSVDVLAVKGSPAVAFRVEPGAALILAPGQGTGGRLLGLNTTDDRDGIETKTNSTQGNGTAVVGAADGSIWFLAWTDMSLTWSSTAVTLTAKTAAESKKAYYYGEEKKDTTYSMVRLAAVPRSNTSTAPRDEPAARPLFECPWTYATGGDVEFDPKDPSKYTLNYHVAADSGSTSCRQRPPLLGLGHHLDVLQSPSSTSSSPYESVKGPMPWIRSKRWQFREELPPTPRVDARVDRVESEAGLADAAKRRLISTQLRRDLRSIRGHATVMAKNGAYGKLYFEGKELARLARLALVAADTKDPEGLDMALLYLERRFERVLRSEDNFAFDPTWGGVVSLPVKQNGDPFSNFGNALYSDHHFHYGYYCYAAAVLCAAKPSWGRRWTRRLRALVHDFANPDPAWPLSSSKTRDPRFPVARHKDFYDGHSWATGLVSYATGKSQESSSEAAHAYFGVAALGRALNDKSLEDWGRLLMATEVRSTRAYWHLPVNASAYSPAFASRNRVTGSVAGSATVAATWFGANPEYLHGIQTLPVVPGLTDRLFQPSFACDQMPVLARALARPRPDAVATSWAGVALASVAVADPHAAWHRAVDLDESKFDDGASKANLLHWIATRPGMALEHHPSPPCVFDLPDDDGDNPKNIPDNGGLVYDGLYTNKSMLTSWCGANLACIAFGLDGLCCPDDNGYVFGCCPLLVTVDDDLEL